MIEMPHRSITRFFVPMIDVLTLLFCIYLLMPIVQDPATGESDAARAERIAREQDRGPALIDDGAEARMRERLEKLRKEAVQTLQSRLRVRVLEIEPKKGTLFYRDPVLGEVTIASVADARKLIGRDREELREDQELYYLILCPRDRFSGFPTRQDRLDHQQWFEGVALAYDEPGQAPGRKP
jgi:hypothetical protein